MTLCNGYFSESTLTEDNYVFIIFVPSIIWRYWHFWHWNAIFNINVSAVLFLKPVWLTWLVVDRVCRRQWYSKPRSLRTVQQVVYPFVQFYWCDVVSHVYGKQWNWIQYNTNGTCLASRQKRIDLIQGCVSYFHIFHIFFIFFCSFAFFWL